MSRRAASLAALLQALAPPLDWLAADDFRQAERIRLPLTALAARLAQAREEEPAEVRTVLAELEGILAALGAGHDAKRADLLRRAHALLPALRAAVAARGPAVAPPDEGGDLEAGLAALRAPVGRLPGIGARRAALLERFGLTTVEDVLYHLPFRYEDRRRRLALAALRPGDEATTEGTVAEVRFARSGRRGRPLFEVVVEDGGGALVLVWFQQAQWFATRFQRGRRLSIYGRVEAPIGPGPCRMVHPEVIVLEEGRRAATPPPVVPVYEKPVGLHAAQMRRLVHAAVDAFAACVPHGVPAEVAARERLLAPARALRHLHRPPEDADIDALGQGTSAAHRSLVFDELFFLQLGLAIRRAEAGRTEGTAFAPPGRLLARLRAALPFRPTRAQERALAEIARDLAAPHPMRRLLHGDVGSGKTLVALMAGLLVVECGHQVALMAPTELLAEQHFATVGPYLAALGVESLLLTGAVRGRARREALAAVAEGRAAFVVGTQALIQEAVAFARLGLAVVDEQHRFGVLQRAALQRQGQAVDVLVMSATPIPRTLALTLYGDLDVSTLDERPPGRTPIATRVVAERERGLAYARIREEAAAGRQAYVIYPVVDEAEHRQLKAAVTMARVLAAGPLAELRLGLVHGRMKAEEKDEVMRRFTAGDLDVLVATTVIEVGIDVPNATLMVVEHAERFGLAQLHQLRGRVGRGPGTSECLLIVAEGTSGEAWERLRTLERTSDGFAIAEADLALRGPGDFLGTRQAGLPPFRVANLLRDTALLRAARDAALDWLARDPELARPESRRVRAVLRHRWGGRLALAAVG